MARNNVGWGNCDTQDSRRFQKAKDLIPAGNQKSGEQIGRVGYAFDRCRPLNFPGRACQGAHLVHNFFPLATCPRRRKVFGYFPWPQILNDPKSLDQGPSGASGSDSRHSFNWLVQVLNGDLPFSKPLEKVIAQGGRQIRPLDLRHLFAEGHLGQYFLDAFPFGGIGGQGKLVRKFKKPRLFCFF